MSELVQVPDVQGSVGNTPEPNLQSRLVMASQDCKVTHDTDTQLSLSSAKIDQNCGLPSEVKENPTLYANRSKHTPSDDDDGRIATEDEVRDLLHVVDKIPTRLWVACVAGILERFVWYGATSPLRAWPHLYSSII